MAKIETLQGQKISAELLLHQLIEHYGKKMKSVVVIMEFKDGSIDYVWNDLPLEDLSLLSDYIKAQVLLHLMRA